MGLCCNKNQPTKKTPNAQDFLLGYTLRASESKYSNPGRTCIAQFLSMTKWILLLHGDGSCTQPLSTKFLLHQDTGKPRRCCERMSEIPHIADSLSQTGSSLHQTPAVNWWWWRTTFLLTLRRNQYLHQYPDRCASCSLAAAPDRLFPGQS